jgi:hypothetical protein
MARMRPELTEDQLRSLASFAESRMYQALRDQLPDDALVVHSAKWVYRARGAGRVSEGESDFVIFLPQNGFLTIEVKGGGIVFDGKTGTWSSLDRNNVSHAIKDPFHQAQRQRFAILDQLNGHVSWRGRKIVCGHAVFFPDLASPAPFAGPDRPIDIIGVRGDMTRLGAWIAGVLRFWTPSNPVSPLGSQGVKLAEDVLCSSIDVKPMLSVALIQEEEIRVRLTDQQARVLRIIGGRSRALIGGGAGTGKTLIALEKARRVARSGQSAVLICYNRRLADALASANRGIPGLEISGFHQLCERRISMAREVSGRDVLAEAQEAYAGEDFYDAQLPFALALANEIVPDKNNAVVIDEAQDFTDEYWLGVEGLLADEGSQLYVFFDPNQMLYKRRGKIPIAEEPFWLTSNCRNTHHIHQAAYRYYSGELTDPPEIAGSPLVHIIGESAGDQADAIVKEIGRLLTKEGVRPSEIVVLVMGKPKQSFYDLMASRTLARGTHWIIESDNPEGILLETVPRFKGLEASIVFLWLPPVVDDEHDRELLYVGLSRGKSLLFLVGSKTACASVGA